MSLLRTTTAFALTAILIASLAGCSESARAATPAPTTELAPAASEDTETPAEITETPEAIEAPAVAEAPETPSLDEPSLHSVEGITARRMVLTRRIEDREPAAATTNFSASSERLYAFFDLRNTTDEDATLFVTFEGPGGRSTGHVELDVPADSFRWRTWAWTQHATEPGEWVAQLHDEEGELLASQPFVVE